MAMFIPHQTELYFIQQNNLTREKFSPVVRIFLPSCEPYYKEMDKAVVFLRKELFFVFGKAVKLMILMNYHFKAFFKIKT